MNFSIERQRGVGRIGVRLLADGGGALKTVRFGSATGGGRMRRGCGGFGIAMR